MRIDLRHSRVTSLLAAMLVLTTMAAAQKPKVRTLTQQEMEDMLLGSSIQASRSSDTPTTLKRLHDAIAAGKTFTMIELKDVPDNWTTVSPGGAGGGGAWQYVNDRTKEQKVPILTNGTFLAAKALSKYIGKPLNAVVRTEGDGATIAGLLLASDMGVPIVDACLSGRARPEIEQQIPTVMGINAYPAAYVTRFGDTVIIDKAYDDYRVEDIARALAVSGGGGAPGVMNAMSGVDAKRGLISGSLTQAIMLGKTVREALAAGKDPVDAILHVMHGYKLFHGIVTRDLTYGDRGFTWSEVTLTGIGADLGHEYKISVKNENVATWYDGVPDATAPDFIQDLDPLTGDAHLGPALGAYKVSAEIVMVGWPNDPRWRSPKGIEVFGPRHFGFKFDYAPIEALQKKRNNPPAQ